MSDAINHFTELRNRFIFSIACLTVAFAFFFIFCHKVFDTLGQIVLSRLPNYEIIATQVTSPFIVLLKLSLLFAIFTTIPVFIYQFCAFIAPGLYKREKKIFYPIVALSTGLFYLGGLFAFLVVCPLALGFFYHFAPSQVSVMTEIGAYYHFISNMVLIFAFSFQIPIAVYCGLYFGVIQPESIKQKRGYIIVGCFTLGMLLTPPDVISQILLAIPLIGLFELGYLLFKVLPKPAMVKNQ